jgi:deoxyguanosine kinase
MPNDELAMYGRVHAALGEKIPKPNLIVYLQADHDLIMRRIALRDRPYERDMDPNYIRELTAAYDAWLSNLPDIPVLTINTNELDFLAREEDLKHVENTIRTAMAQQPATSTAAQARLTLLNGGGLPAYQQFHRQLDDVKRFDPDLLFNYVLLMEEMGQVASALAAVWREGQQLQEDGRSLAEAHQEAINNQRVRLRNELAELLACTLKLANYAGIDLEQAYLEKMNQRTTTEQLTVNS